MKLIASIILLTTTSAFATDFITNDPYSKTSVKLSNTVCQSQLDKLQKNLQPSNNEQIKVSLEFSKNNVVKNLINTYTNINNPAYFSITKTINYRTEKEINKISSDNRENTKEIKNLVPGTIETGLTGFIIPHISEGKLSNFVFLQNTNLESPTKAKELETPNIDYINFCEDVSGNLNQLITIKLSKD